MQTGIKAVDSLVPIGRGQRELIIGDRQTGYDFTKQTLKKKLIAFFLIIVKLHLPLIPSSIKNDLMMPMTKRRNFIAYTSPLVKKDQLLPKF